jgi:hypothetical protein
MQNTKIDYTEFPADKLETLEQRLEHISVCTQAMHYYIRDEAKLDVEQLDNYRIDLYDLQDQMAACMHMIKQLLVPYENELDQIVELRFKQRHGEGA